MKANCNPMYKMTPIIIDPMTASGMLRPGLRVSPPSRPYSSEGRPATPGAQDARDPERGEAALFGGEVRAVEGRDYEHDDGEEGDRDLPDHDHVVGLRQAADTKEVNDGEHTHEYNGKDNPQPRQDLRTSL